LIGDAVLSSQSVASKGLILSDKVGVAETLVILGARPDSYANMIEVCVDHHKEKTAQAQHIRPVFSYPPMLHSPPAFMWKVGIA
jgi:hypothetical protein